MVIPEDRIFHQKIAVFHRYGRLIHGSVPHDRTVVETQIATQRVDRSTSLGMIVPEYTVNKL